MQKKLFSVSLLLVSCVFFFTQDMFLLAAMGLTWRWQDTHLSTPQQQIQPHQHDFPPGLFFG